MEGNIIKRHPFIAAIIGLCVLGAVAWGITAFCITPQVEIGPETGNSAPDFTLQTVDGESITLSDFRGKMVMLNFWGNIDDYDEELVQEARSMQAIRNNWAQKELAILNIVVSSDDAEAQKFAARLGVTFPLLLDSQEEVASAYDVIHYRTYFFIDNKGIIRLAIHGHFRTQQEIEEMLYTIKNNSEISSIVPTITNVLVSATNESATITWTTDEPATSDVILHESYEGELSVCYLVLPDETLVTDHHITMGGLSPNTTYDFQVLSGYSLRNQTLSKKYSFVTVTDTTPPEISEIEVSDITKSSVTITWTTDEETNIEIGYWTTDTSDQVIVLIDELATEHSITLSGLQPDTPYHVEIKSKDASGNEAVRHIFPVATLSEIPSMPKIGDPAPGFTLQTINGETITLGELRGKKVMIIFWLVGCNACVREMPHVQEVYENWSDEELVILAINIKERAETVRRFIEIRGFTFPVMLDTERTVDQLYQPPFFPITFFIDTEGTIREIKEGRFNNVAEIEDLLHSF